MKKSINRRGFLKTAVVSGIGLGVAGSASSAYARSAFLKENRVGIIGLDTSHSIAFTKILNDPEAGPELADYRVVAAYPYGSKKIETSVKRIPRYTEEIKEMGVEVVGSIDELLKKVDVVLLETNDGRLHLEQALPVIKARKPLFIDKPMAASLADAIAIFNAAKQYQVPVFSSSSLRYAKNAQEVRQGQLVGRVLGADTFSPAKLEKTHPDLFWYGIHGIELLYTVMSTGCKSVTRTHTENTDVVVGVWGDGRIGTYRGGRWDKIGYGGNAFGEERVAELGPSAGYKPLLVEVVKFFRTGKSPVSQEETLEIFAFMEAADESKRRGGQAVSLESVFAKAN